MSVREDMRDYRDAHPNRSPEDLATMFLSGCHKEDLLPLVEVEFRAIERSESRYAEIERLRGGAERPRLRTVEQTRIALADLASLLDMPYRIGDGRPRLFRHLTRDEHLTRVAMLEGQVGGLQRAISAHHDAIFLLDTHGVDCLDDINEQEEAA